jgi:hypothetical protein
MESAKNKPLFFAGSDKPKRQGSLPFLGVKATKSQDRAAFSLGFHGLKAKLALPSNPNLSGKR